MTTKPRKRLSPKERQARDDLIQDLFVAGHPQSKIAAHPQVNLTEARVSQIIKAELDRAAKDHILRNTNAMTIYTARMEYLVRQAMSHVEAGELKAIEVGRRLMADQIKVYDLVEERLVGSAGPVPPLSDNELDVEVEPEDELAAYRAQRSKTAT